MAKNDEKVAEEVIEKTTEETVEEKVEKTTEETVEETTGKKYIALISFCGVVTMAQGEVKEITDTKVVKDLLKAKYIKEVK